MLFKRRFRQTVPPLNTTSTADISFMLLVFFLITTSMDSRMGLQRVLTPADDEHHEKQREVERRNVMILQLDAHGKVSCNGKPADLSHLADILVDFIANEQDDPQKPLRTNRIAEGIGQPAVCDMHIIQIEAAPTATYDAYFAVQNSIVAAYKILRERYAQRYFHRTFAQLSPEQRQAVVTCVPQRIAEVDSNSVKGGEQ